MLASARFSGPVLNGRLGSSPLHLAAAGGQIVGKQLRLQPRSAMRLGKPASPIAVRRGAADRHASSAADVRGKFGGAKATIGNVPLLLSDGVGQVARA